MEYFRFLVSNDGTFSNEWFGDAASDEVGLVENHGPKRLVLVVRP